MEEWKDIAGYDGLYQVSSFGNVKSLNWRGTKTEKVMVPKHHNRGYLQIELAKDGKCKTFLIHRLVAQAFIDNPSNFPEVNHKDENKANNNLSNLEWCGRTENVHYSRDLHKDDATTKIRRLSVPVKNTRRILQMNRDGSSVKLWDNLVSIKHSHKWVESSIKECCEGKRKSAYGYIWCYYT